MDVKRRLVPLAAFAWLTLCVPLAEAGPLDACAQRVIRDWYTGGRVDQLYPLGCYRAAIRALPNDVLEYSNADEDIARALAFARKAKADESGQTATEPRLKPSAPTATEPVAPVTATPPPATPTVPEALPPAASRPSPTTPSATPERAPEPPQTVAAGPDPVDVSGTVPYPVIVLAALAGTLLAAGAAGWLLARRR